MGIEFERGAFENPESPLSSDDVDSSIVVVVGPADRGAAEVAVRRCVGRWWGIDGAGRHHDDDDREFWDAQPAGEGGEWHTAKAFDVSVTPAGIEVVVDAQSFMPGPMRAAYRRVLVEELKAAGVHDAVVRSVFADQYQQPEPPAGSWPPYQDQAVPGLPPGVLPGEVLDQGFRRRGDFFNLVLGRQFRDVWQATAVVATAGTPDEVVRTVCEAFERAGWRVTGPVSRQDWDDKPVVVATAARDRAVASVLSRPVDDLVTDGVAVPADADQVTLVSAYYEPES